MLSMILFALGLAAPASARSPGDVYLLLHLILLAVAGWLDGKRLLPPKN